MARRTGGTLGSMSISDLRREIARRQRSTGTLARSRARIMKKIAALDAQIAELGGSVSGAGGGRPRPRNDMNLPDALAAAFKGKTMTIGEAIEAVQKAGYRSAAKSFRTMVNIALINSGKFTRVGRGQYAVKR